MRNVKKNMMRSVKMNHKKKVIITLSSGKIFDFSIEDINSSNLDITVIDYDMPNDDCYLPSIMYDDKISASVYNIDSVDYKDLYLKHHETIDKFKSTIDLYAKLDSRLNDDENKNLDIKALYALLDFLNIKIDDLTEENNVKIFFKILNIISKKTSNENIDVKIKELLDIK